MKKEINNELKNMDSVLSKVKNGDIYNAPDNYFETMQNSIFEKLQQEKSPKVVSLRINKWIMSIAASLIIVVAVMFFIKQNSDTNAQLANSDIIEYLNVYVDDFDETDFAKYLNEEDLSISNETAINTDDIENYLDDNIDDLNEEDLQQLF